MLPATQSRRRDLCPLAALIVLAASLFGGPFAFAQLPPQLPPSTDTRDENFERVDPYTKGDSKAMDKAGYVSYGPFLLADGMKTQDVEEAIGTTNVLWLETAHFRFGSTLKSYKYVGDQKEAKRLKEDLERLAGRFDKLSPPRGKLDPWLRLHLTALRFEELYARLQERFGLSDADFDPKQKTNEKPALGDGPYLGMPHKFTVLLLEKESTLVRFAKRFLNQEPKTFVRWRLGGSMVLALSAEGVRGYGYDLESAFTCMAVAEQVHNLLDGYKNTWTACPLWFKYGLAHEASRAVDERWTVSALGTSREFGDDSWKWKPRIGRLLANGFVKGFDDIIGWALWDDIKPQGHMLAWSRVTWLMERKGTDRRQLLDDLCTLQYNLPDDQRGKHYAQKSEAALKKATGLSLEELDLEWRAHVEKTYSK